MTGNVVPIENLFEVIDVFGKKIRTSQSYWKKITEEKHQDLKLGLDEVKKTIAEPQEVFRSVKDDSIMINYQRFRTETLVVVTKHMNGDGFLITAYQTTKSKRKGEKLWPK